MYTEPRIEMLRAIAADTRQTRDYLGKDALAPEVMAAMARVPRHEFVPEDLRRHAYDNRPLPIGLGQTISQPYIVALMTDLLECGPQAKVLEVGTGSGYQAAVLAERPHDQRAAEVLKALGYGNVEVRIGDGYLGWPEAAPFDAIVVTAAPEHMPQPLIDQLAPGGRLIAPIGSRFGIQQLQLLRKDAQGRAVTRSVLEVRFVPLTRER